MIKGHVLQECKIEINVKPHDEFRLEALDAILNQLNPSIIAVTGDVTTYGDRESFEFALEKLLERRQKYNHVYCVPGNHDALQERFNDLRAEGGGVKVKVEALTGLIKSFKNVFKGSAASGQGVVPMPFLESYDCIIAKKLECPADPGTPQWVETPWGWLCFFVFVYRLEIGAHVSRFFRMVPRTPVFRRGAEGVPRAEYTGNKDDFSNLNGRRLSKMMQRLPWQGCIF